MSDTIQAAMNATQEIADSLKWPERCCVSVSRKGEEQPCDKTAVAVALLWDDWDGRDRPGAVCAFHAQGRMVPLSEIVRVVGCTPQLRGGV
jgi:hypothetical protein